MQARQGDLFFKPVDSIPEEAALEKGRLVLAEGEVTGHSHRVSQKGVALLYLVGIQLYMRALKQVTIIHDEHGPVTLPPGDYMVKNQRELDPWGHVRQILD